MHLFTEGRSFAFCTSYHKSCHLPACRIQNNFCSVFISQQSNQNVIFQHLTRRRRLPKTTVVLYMSSPGAASLLFETSEILYMQTQICTSRQWDDDTNDTITGSSLGALFLNLDLSQPELNFKNSVVLHLI